MNDEELNKLAWRIYEALAAKGVIIGNASVSIIRKELKAFKAGVREAALEEAATRAFQVVQAIDAQPYSTLQKAASVAASVRGLKESATQEEK